MILEDVIGFGVVELFLITAKALLILFSYAFYLENNAFKSLVYVCVCF